MTDYIEREKVYDIFAAKQQKLLKYHRYYQLNDADKEEFDLYDSYMNEVESIPSADVVEVVRCKDCKHFCPYEGEEHKGDCAELVGLESCVYEDDFCSYGERRSN